MTERTPKAAKISEGGIIIARVLTVYQKGNPSEVCAPPELELFGCGQVAITMVDAYALHGRAITVAYLLSTVSSAESTL